MLSRYHTSNISFDAMKFVGAGVCVNALTIQVPARVNSLAGRHTRQP
jgi:hypothetical protein